MEDYFDDDFMDDDMIPEDDFEDMDGIEGGDIIEQDQNTLDVEETPENGISLEDFLFWGGFMGMMIDEEREEKRLAEKADRTSAKENLLDTEDK